MPHPACGRAGGRFTKDRFDVDLLSGTVTCPAGTTVAIRARGDGSGTAAFGAACHGCALRGDCTDAAGGRTVRISANEAALGRWRPQPEGSNASRQSLSYWADSTPSPSNDP